MKWERAGVLLLLAVCVLLLTLSVADDPAGNDANWFRTVNGTEQPARRQTTARPQWEPLMPNRGKAATGLDALPEALGEPGKPQPVDVYYIGDGEKP